MKYNRIRIEGKQQKLFSLLRFLIQRPSNRIIKLLTISFILGELESAVYARQGSMMMQGGVGGPPQMSSVQSSVVLQENIAPPQPNWVPKAYLDKVLIYCVIIETGQKTINCPNPPSFLYTKACPLMVVSIERRKGCRLFDSFYPYLKFWTNSIILRCSTNQYIFYMLNSSL